MITCADPVAQFHDGCPEAILFCARFMAEVDTLYYFLALSLMAHGPRYSCAFSRYLIQG